MSTDYDVVVVGSGAGGAAFAHACASAGKSVLVVERGNRPQPAPAQNERITLIEKQPYDDRQILVNDAALRLYMGGVLGGGTAVYGGVMLRPSSDDFHPGRHYARRLPRELWDWPITYADLQPYYDDAESLYRLTGTDGDGYQPLHPPRRNVISDSLPLAPINERLRARTRACGLRPFRLPLAIDRARCAHCADCAGYLCPNGARRSAAQIVDETARRHQLHVQTGMEVERLETGPNGRIAGIHLRERATGTASVVRGRSYALAAGAIGSPAILLRSGLDAHHVGRNYMMHYSPISVGIFARPTGASHSFVKQLGFADYYFGTRDLRYKMGLVQSLPAPGPLMLAKSGLRRWPRCALAFLRRRMLPLAGIVEDLPQPSNRVQLRSDGSIKLTHEFSAFDCARGRSLGLAMCRILKHAGAVACTSRSFPSREHVAHQCGTLRFGADPRHAVVDRDCRMFGWSNLFVVDGSVLPTSLGVGPSLTIVANALRVARIALASL